MSELQDLREALERCARRVTHLEKWIGKLIEANDANEAGNFQDALEKLRRALERV